MTIKSIEELKVRPREIDLTGPEGNAFYILGLADTFSKQIGLDVTKIKEEMMSGDYDHLIEVFESYFGDYVTLYH